MEDLHAVVGVIPQARRETVLLRVLVTERAIAQNISRYIWTHPVLMFMSQLKSITTLTRYRICSRNLRTFFFILTSEKSGCVKYADFFLEVLIWVLF